MRPVRGLVATSGPPIHGDNLRCTEPCITKLSQDNQPPYDNPLRSGHPQAQSPETTPTPAKPDSDTLAVLPVKCPKGQAPDIFFGERTSLLRTYKLRAPVFTRLANWRQVAALTVSTGP